jgi:hypothetical protein
MEKTIKYLENQLDNNTKELYSIKNNNCSLNKINEVKNTYSTNRTDITNMLCEFSETELLKQEILKKDEIIIKMKEDFNIEIERLKSNNKCNNIKNNEKLINNYFEV